MEPETKTPEQMTIPALEKTIAFLAPILSKWNYAQKPLIISLSGPQGSGKSFLSAKLIDHFTTAYPHLNTLTVSTDDLYLTHDDQKRLREEHPENTLLKGRGVPGTHDVDLAFKLMADLDNRKTGFLIPRYEKSAFDGEGDRAPKDEWYSVDEPVDIVVLEGWFNGFTPFEDDDAILDKTKDSALLQKYDPEHLFEINSNLSDYFKIWDFADVDIFYDTDNIHNVYDWRIQQEHELIAKKGSGMTDDQVRDFIERYMVVYELYYRDFTQLGIRSTAEGQHLRLKIDKLREVVADEVF